MDEGTAATGHGDTGLARVLGLLDVVGIVVGSVIGSGIFIVPATVAFEVRSPVVILAVWVVGGVLTLFGALCFAELGGMYPQAGGTYVYLREAYGPLVAFLFGWTLFLVVDSGAMATLSSAFATKYLPYFVTLSPLGSRMVTLAFIGFLVTVNYLGVRHGANLQNLLAAIKLVAIVAVVGLILTLGHGSAANFERPPVEPLTLGAASRFGAALIACLWAYKGWEAATYSSGELRNPQRNLFLGLLAGCLLVTVLYLAINLAYLWVLPAETIAASPRIAADALAAAVGPGSASFISALILMSILGSANANLLTAPRVYYAMAKDGLFFARAGEAHPRYRTPHLAILAMGAWTAVLAMSGTFEQLLGYVVFGLWIFFGLTVGAVLILRRTRPEIPRPVRVWGFPATPMLFLASTVFIAVSALATGPRNALAGTAIIALGVPVFLLWRARRSVNARAQKSS
jgi:basic amino acid/polyamine antiporter, APA family